MEAVPVQQELVLGQLMAAQSPQHHRGEVALVTPVRAVSSLRLEEVEEHSEPRHADPVPLKKSDCVVEERPISTPASPDPNNDPQTVWRKCSRCEDCWTSCISLVLRLYATGRPLGKQTDLME
ncbi:hypothetical protein MHYP_G00137250 [Metynnis hypsauchen]